MTNPDTKHFAHLGTSLSFAKGDITDLVDRDTITSLRIVETSEIFYRVYEGSYAGMWESDSRVDYVGDSVLFDLGTPVVRTRIG